MREILFRGKRIDNGEWVEGYLVPFTQNSYVKGYEIIDEDGIEYDELDNYNPCFCSDRVIPETIGQYTGLTDKNGKKIFEGDILAFCKGATYPYKIIWDGMGWKLIRSDGKRIKEAFECNEIHYVGFSEVIGNIHDNPELMKGGVE